MSRGDREHRVSHVDGGSMTIAILGGTGPEGLGIAARLAAAGESVVIGSRDAGRAADAARLLTGEVAGARLRGLRNPEAAAAADLVVIAVPAPGLASLLRGPGPGCRDRIVPDVVTAVGVVAGASSARKELRTEPPRASRPAEPGSAS